MWEGGAMKPKKSSSGKGRVSPAKTAEPIPRLPFPLTAPRDYRSGRFFSEQEMQEYLQAVADHIEQARTKMDTEVERQVREDQESSGVSLTRGDAIANVTGLLGTQAHSQSSADHDRRSKRSPDKLSASEKAVLYRICSGLSKEQVAAARRAIEFVTRRRMLLARSLRETRKYMETFAQVIEGFVWRALGRGTRGKRKLDLTPDLVRMALSGRDAEGNPVAGRQDGKVLAARTMLKALVADRHIRDLLDELYPRKHRPKYGQGRKGRPDQPELRIARQIMDQAKITLDTQTELLRVTRCLSGPPLK
jgi:hypothetical protein